LPFHVKQQYLRKVSEELAAFTDDDRDRERDSSTGAHVSTSSPVRLSS
jgi:hypothetical protein